MARLPLHSPRLPLFVLVVLVTACAGREPSPPDDVLVRVDRVALDANHAPVLVLEERDGSRWLPIWIGTAEAHSIALQIEERTSPRPNTHDLAQRVIRGLEGTVERVVVTDLKRGTYFAVLSLRTGDRVVEIDSRPSDAIAIALRTGAPVFVRARLFAETANEPEPPVPEGEAQPEREI